MFLCETTDIRGVAEITPRACPTLASSLKDQQTVGAAAVWRIADRSDMDPTSAQCTTVALSPRRALLEP